MNDALKGNILIIGSGIAGMSAALTACEKGYSVSLISSISAERAQSVMAEGGINAALNTKGEDDDPTQHEADTMRSAAGIVSGSAVRGMTQAAPIIVSQLHSAGVRFNLDENANVDLRNFGGQKKKRTAFAKDDTGRQIVTALVDAVRRYEHTGKVTRYPHHLFCTLLFSEDRAAVSNENGETDRSAGVWVCGARIKDIYTNEEMDITANATIVCSGGLHGLLADTTGSLNDTGAVTAELFRSGVPLSNLEMVQYHPTTVRGNGKRMLITEAARGEGGRLFAWRTDHAEQYKWYFMEEKYELGNLMPRDVTAREIHRVMTEEGLDVFLDLTELPADVLDGKLTGLVSDVKTYLGIDPSVEPIPVKPGIHYFMGGIMVDDDHKTIYTGLYAAGECAAQYHGANRLGGNSLLGAAYGGHVAAENACEDMAQMQVPQADRTTEYYINEGYETYDDQEDVRNVQKILQCAMAVARDEKMLREAIEKMEGLRGSMANVGRAMLMSALERKESRGGHYRRDFPERDNEKFEKISVAIADDGDVNILFAGADSIDSWLESRR